MTDVAQKMIPIFYVILIMAVLMTLPLGSRRLAYSHRITPNLEYEALAGLSKQTRKAVYASFTVLLIIMVLFCVYKSEEVPDYMMYERVYEMNGSRNMHKEMELTYGWICQVSPNFLFLLGIYAILSCGFHLYAILRNSPNVLISMLVYISYFFVLHDLIQIRAAVAIAIFLFALRYISERKWYVYFPLAIVALLFHNSAVVFIPLYFLPRKNINRYIWGALLLGALLCGLAGIQIGVFSRYIPLKIVDMYMGNYLGSKEYVGSTIGPMRVFECLVGLVMIWKIKTIQTRYPYAVVCIILYTISQMCFLLLGDIPVLQTRMGEMFASVNIFAVAMFPLISRKHYYLLMVVPLLIIIYHMGSTMLLLSNQPIP